MIPPHHPRDDLAAAAAQAKPRPKTGVRAILTSLHRSPDTAQQVKIETQALPPALTRSDGQCILTSLLSEARPGTDVINAPWGAVRWTWPAGTFVGIERWDGAPDGVSGWSGSWATPDASTFNAVLDAIDTAGPDPTPAELAEVRARLRQAVPPPAMTFYRSLDSADEGTGPAERPTTSHAADGETVATRAREAARAASTYGLASMTERLDRYRTERSRGSFRSCVVGEFNRGKTTLVNRLLGRDILPTGPVPTTRSIVVVRAADVEALTVQWPDGRTEDRPLDDAAFTGLTLDHDPSAVTVAEGEQAAPEPRLTLAVDDDWLRSLDVELIDTPGTNEGRIDRVLQVQRAVMLSDLVVMAISALSPLSLTEQRLLQDEILKRHVAHVVVVITMLDLVDATERSEAAASLTSRIRALAPDALVLQGSGAVQQLRAAIANCAGSGRATDRNRRWALQVADCCDEMAKVAQEALDQQRLDAKARATVIEKAEAEVRRAATTWEQIRLDLDSRRVRLRESLLSVLNARTSELSEVLFHELERAPDPNTWWQRDLPFRMRRELQAISTAFEGRLAKAVTDDLLWLEQRAATDLGVNFKHSSPAVNISVTEPLHKGEVEDLTRTRRLTRLAGPAGLVVGYIAALAASAAMPLIWTTIAATGATILSERRVADLTAQQRAEVKHLLNRAVTETFRSFEIEVDRTIAAVYGQIRDHLQIDQRSWSESRLSALAQKRHGDIGPDWQTLHDKATHLATTIRSSLDTQGAEA